MPVIASTYFNLTSDCHLQNRTLSSSGMNYYFIVVDYFFKEIVIRKRCSVAPICIKSSVIRNSQTE